MHMPTICEAGMRLRSGLRLLAKLQSCRAEENQHALAVQLGFIFFLPTLGRKGIKDNRLRLLRTACELGQKSTPPSCTLMIWLFAVYCAAASMAQEQEGCRPNLSV